MKEQTSFLKGIKDGFPICIGSLSISFAFGIYACSPEDSSFTATFTNMELTECKWLPHNGQQPDAE